MESWTNLKQPVNRPSAPMPDSHDALRKLIDDSGLSLLHISKKATVPYGPLYRWYRRSNPAFNWVSAEAVYHSLTGKTFIAAAGKPGRKGKAAA